MCDLHSEPGLDELLQDQAAQLLMRRDGVEEAQLRLLLAQMSRHLSQRPEIAAPPP